MSNPWLSIPPEEYEAHMASPAVAQLPALSRVLARDLARHCPGAFLLLGCATGNGLEHVDPTVSERVVALDLNPAYLERARERHAARLPQLELVQADVMQAVFPDGSFDLIHAALLLEYVDPVQAVPRIANWLRPGGHLTVVLQERSVSTPPVTPTEYASVEALASVLRLVDADVLGALAARAGLVPTRRESVPLPGGKAFLVLTYRRGGGLQAPETRRAEADLPSGA